MTTSKTMAAEIKAVAATDSTQTRPLVVAFGGCEMALGVNKDTTLHEVITSFVYHLLPSGVKIKGIKDKAVLNCSNMIAYELQPSCCGCDRIPLNDCTSQVRDDYQQIRLLHTTKPYYCKMPIQPEEPPELPTPPRLPDKYEMKDKEHDCYDALRAHCRWAAKDKVSKQCLMQLANLAHWDPDALSELYDAGRLSLEEGTKLPRKPVLAPPPLTLLSFNA